MVVNWLETPKSRVGCVQEGYRRPTRGTAPSSAPAHPATRRQRYPLGAERLVEESPSGDIKALPPDEPSGFHSAAALGHFPTSIGHTLRESPRGVRTERAPRSQILAPAGKPRIAISGIADQRE